MLGGSSGPSGGLGSPSSLGGGLGSSSSNPTLNPSSDQRLSGPLVSESAPSLGYSGPSVVSPPVSPVPSTQSFRTGKNIVAPLEQISHDGEIRYGEDIMQAIKRHSLEVYNPKALKPNIMSEQEAQEHEKKLGKGMGVFLPLVLMLFH